MTDDTATWTEKFDRWWAEPAKEHLDPRTYSIQALARAAFMAGAAAERAEHQRPWSEGATIEGVVLVDASDDDD